MNKIQRVIAVNDEMIRRGKFQERIALAYLQYIGHTEEEAMSILEVRGVMDVFNEFVEENPACPTQP